MVEAGDTEIGFLCFTETFCGRDEIITAGRELSQWLLVNLVKLVETIKKI